MLHLKINYSYIIFAFKKIFLQTFKVTEATFVLVARDPLNRGSAVINKMKVAKFLTYLHYIVKLYFKTFIKFAISQTY